MEVYEKLGAFYLGREYSLESKETNDDLVLYDSKDLLTHAFCVGMTGSGKTGLCVSLLEEAAIDGVPSIIIDPKGDLANLLLTFPDLAPSDFRPWVNEDSARQKDMSADEFAKGQAELWRKGLASWDQDGDRIRRLKEAADFTIYTPGSEAGVPVSILTSFAAPPKEILDDSDLLNERISTTATSLLGLLDIDADPIKSREHILISNIFETEWKAGRDLDLGGLITTIQKPPISRIGVLELESFYPEKDRFILAMALNNLLASPSFETWLTGDPLDINQMLYTKSGKPRMSIFSIAHLSDSERMFFVSLLLNQTLGWMRSRAGTTSLRAILYMDEIFGYIPPVANPPSKKPLLTLLKQARAFGVGVVLATQNPVDLDYKGLSNTGTWFIGRLQTERDKQRVLDGLEGASAGASGAFKRREMEETLAGLGKRVFLLHNVHEHEPVIFHTRWAMSYLSGPLTRQQIKTLMAPRKASIESGTQTAKAPSTTTQSTRPVLAPDIPQVFLPALNTTTETTLVYEPGALGIAVVHFAKRGGSVEHSERCALFSDIDNDRVDWADANELTVSEDDVTDEPAGRASFGEIPAGAGSKKNHTTWRKSFADMLYRTKRCTIYKSKLLKMTSDPGESERDFRIRLAETAREQRDASIDKLRKKYGAKADTIEDRVRRAELAVDKEKEQAKQQKMQTVISLGTTLLSAFLGRKRVSRTTIGRATTTARGMGRAAKEAQDIDRAKQNVAALKERLQELENELREEIDKIEERFNPETAELKTTTLKPRKSDIDIKLFALGWGPYKQTAQGGMTAAWPSRPDGPA